LSLQYRSCIIDLFPDKKKTIFRLVFGFVLCPHLEPILSGGHVHASNVDEAGELRVVVALEEGEDGADALGGDEQLELVPGRDLHLLDVLGEAGGGVLTKLGQVLALLEVELAHGRCENETCQMKRIYNHLVV
jgi:hypothetical protein